MANNPVINTLTFSGSIAEQATIQAQGIAGGLTFLLPNIVPVQGQLLTATSIIGNNVFLGWSSQQSLSGIPLADLAQDGATNGQVIAWNGTAWAPANAGGGGTPGGSTGQLQWNNAGAFDGATNSKIISSGAVVLGTGVDGSPVATTGLTVTVATSGQHAQDWFTQNEGFVVSFMTGDGQLHSQGAVISNTINFGASALQVHGGFSGSPDIAQFFTPIGGTPSNTKVVWIDVNGNLNLLEGLKDSTGALGTNGQVLTSTSTATLWSTLSFAPIASPTFTGVVTLPTAPTVAGVVMVSDNQSSNGSNAPIYLHNTAATQKITITPNGFFGPQIQLEGQTAPYTLNRLTEVGAQGLYMINSGFAINGNLGTSGQVLSSLGVNADGGPNGLAWIDSTMPLKATVTLTGSQIANLNTTPIQILAAPGAGLVYNLISSFWSYTFATTPFTSTPNDGTGFIAIVPNANFASSFYYSAITLSSTFGGMDLTVAASQVAMGGQPYGGDTVANAVNQPMVIAAQSNTIGGAGDGTLKIVLYYTVEAA